MFTFNSTPDRAAVVVYEFIIISFRYFAVVTLLPYVCVHDGHFYMVNSSSVNYILEILFLIDPGQNRYHSLHNFRYCGDKIIQITTS